MKVKLSTIQFTEYTQVTLSNTRNSITFRTLKATEVAITERAIAMLAIADIKEKRVLNQFLKQLKEK